MTSQFVENTAITVWVKCRLVVVMMTDPAFGIKHQVEHLVAIQIDTLRKQSSLTSEDLDEYHSRSETITALYRQLDEISRERFHYVHQKAS